MRYIDIEGQTATGTVWAPGPVANSVWVIEDGHCPRAPGSAVVVRLPKGDVTAAYEFDYVLPGIEEKSRGLVWKHATPQRGRDGWTDIFIPTEDYRDAPKLPGKVWRAAVGDQCEQLELTAA